MQEILKLIKLSKWSNFVLLLAIVLLVGAFTLSNRWAITAIVLFVVFGILVIGVAYFNFNSPSTTKYHRIVVKDIYSLAMLVNLSVDQINTTDHDKIRSIAEAIVVSKAAYILDLEEDMGILETSVLSHLSVHLVKTVFIEHKNKVKDTLKDDCRLLSVFGMGDWTIGHAFEEARKLR